MNISNKEFLQAIFGPSFIWAHVTDFFHDPGIGFTDESKQAWLGNYYVNSELRKFANQYFTISLFHETADGARRRKELFKSTHCIVVDDVGEKIPLDLMLDKPAPSWILETSPGSQQWGYILVDPCKERSLVENLLTGLVHKICPDGIDSGMLGVTRYVRLPEGYNTKKSKVKLNSGKIFKCNMIIWQPEVKISITDLADAFEIDLSQSHKSFSSGDYDFLEDHYASQHPAWKLLEIKNILDEGHYDINCPWANEHTDPSDNRATVFILADGYMSFKCHHGHCASRSGKDILAYLKMHVPDWDDIYLDYRKELIKLNPVKPCPIKCKKKQYVCNIKSKG
jgi:hypothetical protein